MKKILISLILMLLLTGCWNYKELNDYSIVTGIAIDKINDEYELSILISNASKGNSEKDTSPQIIVYSGKGNTIMEALKDIGLISSKEIYLGHFSVLLLSEDVAREGINNVIDLFLRESSTKKVFYVAITKDSSAKDILKIVTPLSDFPAQSISDNLRSTTKLQGLISNVNFNEVLSTLNRSGIELTINSVSLIGNIEEGSEKENIENSEPKAYVKLGPLALFKGDKFIGWANNNETIGINIIKDKMNEMYIKIDFDDSYVVLNTTSFKTDVKVKLKNNEPNVKIESDCEAEIIEVNGKIDLTSDNTINEITKKANKELKEYINKALNLSMKYKSDFFGFGLKFYQNYPKYYSKVKDNWENKLSDINFNIKTTISINNKGSAKNSLEELKNER